MAKEVQAVYRALTLMDALLDKGERKPLAKVRTWHNVERVVCPHCGTYVRFSNKALEELLIPNSAAFDGGFKEYCYECGKKIYFPPMVNFIGGNGYV